MMKKALCLMLTLLMLLSCCNLAAAETATYSWWIPRGEDSSYYDNYAQNPTMQYLLSTPYGGKQVSIDFWQGIAGSERENFNNMIATGDLADVIDLTYSDYSATTLWEDGYILDLTDLIAEHMPNYQAFLANSQVANEMAWCYVDGEPRQFFLVSNYLAEPFAGYCYRRDWVAKYGVNPTTGAAFTYGFDENGKWFDDVVFPCGKTDPYYISDWEWMLEIFARALADQGVTDGYPTSIFYQGVMGTGDFFTAFGGGNPWWYRDSEGNAAFGGDSESMRAYLKCMNTWYEKGWIDKHFAERSGDLYFAIDSTTVHQGKVGLWIGRQAEVGNAMDIDTPLTDGIMVYGCPQPINDIYGGEAQKNQLPTSYYLNSGYQLGVAISTKAKTKDLVPLLKLLDVMYEPTTAKVVADGLSAEMMAQQPADAPWVETYSKFGHANGLWATGEPGQKYSTVYLYTDVLVANALRGNRLVKGDYELSYFTEISRSSHLQSTMDLWAMYENSGYMWPYIDGLISTRDISRKSKIENNMKTYMNQTLPKFIMGQKDFDIDNDKDWGNYVKVLNKYGVKKVTDMYQGAIDLMKE